MVQRRDCPPRRANRPAGGPTASRIGETAEESITVLGRSSYDGTRVLCEERNANRAFPGDHIDGEPPQVIESQTESGLLDSCTDEDLYRTFSPSIGTRLGFAIDAIGPSRPFLGRFPNASSAGDARRLGEHVSELGS